MSLIYINTTSTNHYEDYEHITVFGGDIQLGPSQFTCAIPATPTAVRLIKQNDEVRMYIGAAYANSQAESLIMIADLLPERFRPLDNCEAHIRVIDDGMEKDGSIFITPSGRITISNGAFNTNFTGGGQITGFNSCVVSWHTKVGPPLTY